MLGCHGYYGLLYFAEGLNQHNGAVMVTWIAPSTRMSRDGSGRTLR